MYGELNCITKLMNWIELQYLGLFIELTWITRTLYSIIYKQTRDVILSLVEIGNTFANWGWKIPSILPHMSSYVFSIYHWLSLGQPPVHHVWHHNQQYRWRTWQTPDEIADRSKPLVERDSHNHNILNFFLILCFSQSQSHVKLCDVSLYYNEYTPHWTKLKGGISKCDVLTFQRLHTIESKAQSDTSLYKHWLFNGSKRVPWCNVLQIPLLVPNLIIHLINENCDPISVSQVHQVWYPTDLWY